MACCSSAFSRHLSIGLKMPVVTLQGRCHSLWGIVSSVSTLEPTILGTSHRSVRLLLSILLRVTHHHFLVSGSCWVRPTSISVAMTLDFCPCTVERTPSHEIFLDFFYPCAHCGSRCRTTCLHKTCSSTCHHM